MNSKIFTILLREEINLWWKQALKDLEAAEINLKNKVYYVAAFLS
jgi:HEPN domain-containing protein